MTLEFTGAALPLDADSISKVLADLNVGASELWAVLTVETRGWGFLPDRRPAILFERHVFHRLTGGKHDIANQNISSPEPGDYGAAGSHQYTRLAQAIALDKEAALKSASWGLGQIMGFNFMSAGYSSVEAMVAAMSESEGNQLVAMVGPMVQNRWVQALRAHDWTTFAKGYNGPDAAKNNYGGRLSGAYHKYAFGGLPDVELRAAQIYLTFLGLEPGPVDGVMGRFTRSSLSAFQSAHGLPISDVVDGDLLKALNAAVRATLQ